MGVERVDYSSEDEFQQALHQEQREYEAQGEEQHYQDQLHEAMAQFQDWIGTFPGGIYEAAKSIKYPIDMNSLFELYCEGGGKGEKPEPVKPNNDFPF